MSLTGKDFYKRGLFDAIVSTYNDPVNARILLRTIDFPPAHMPRFPDQGGDPRAFWEAVATRLENGVIVDGYDALVRAAAETFPQNPTFRTYIDATQPTAPQAAAGQPSAAQPPPSPITHTPPLHQSTFRNNTASNEVSYVMVGGNVDEEQLLQRAQQLAQEQHMDPASVRLRFRNDEGIMLDLVGWDSERVPSFSKALRSRLEQDNYRVDTSHGTGTFADYLISQLYVEGPDEQRFEINNVRASTSVKEVAQTVMGQYNPQMNQGGRRQVVVDRVNPGGTTERLAPDQSLHDANVRDGDTLNVNPQSTAGGLMPDERNAALVRVRLELERFAAGHPGFQVMGNVKQAPTQYVIKFQAPGFEPPATPDGQPHEIHEHEVFIDLPDAFPMMAPAVFWQHPLFHPNVHLESRKVCLGILEDQYVPSMDFGRLCQMIIDIASYRDYALHHGYYNRAALDWAMSREGQAAIQRIGGKTLEDAVLKPFWEQRILKDTGVSLSLDNPPRKMSIKPYRAEK